MILLATILLLAHDWYPLECCRVGHCHPVPCAEIGMSSPPPCPAGWSCIGPRLEWHGFTNFNYERTSPDGQCHVCVDTLNRLPFCIYTPRATS